MKTKCLENSLSYVSDFKIFGSATHLFKGNQRNLNRAEIKLVASNIFTHLNNSASRLSKQTSPKVSASTQPTGNVRSNDTSSGSLLRLKEGFCLTGYMGNINLIMNY